MKASANNKFWLLSILPLLAIATIAIRSRQRLPSAPELASPAIRDAALATLPPVMLWAWERPEKLDFIDPKKIGVAFLAKTIFLRADNVVSKPRLQPLTVREGTRMVAVVRIESDRRDTPQLSTQQLERAAAEVTALARLPNLTAIQIDFDATLSERDFYQRLLAQVRHDLPQTMPLSITALASWCAGDRWLSDLPVDETVPMLFRLGVERRQFESRLKSGEQFLAAPCQSAAGVSTDEPVAPPANQRLYIFNPVPWSQASVNSAMEAYNK